MKNTPYWGNIEVILFISYSQTENNKCLKFDEQISVPSDYKYSTG